MGPAMKLRDLIRGIPVNCSGNCDIDVKGLKYDSRFVTPGDMFVALRGMKTDGHMYISDAVRSGAVAILAERGEAPEDIVMVKVPNSRKALALVSDRFYGRPSRDLSIVGITGTNGKTTVSYLVRSIFEAAGIQTGLIGTVEYRIGDKVAPASRTTPEAPEIQKYFRDMADAGQRAVVMEVSSHALVLDRTYGIDFDIAVFTNLTQDHLDFHRTREEYMRAKLILFQNLSSNAKAIVNADDPVSSVIAEETKAEVITYGFSRNADIRVEEFAVNPQGTEMIVMYRGSSRPLRVNLGGRFNISNALAAVGTGIAKGIGWDAIWEGIVSVKSVPGRFERVDVGQPFMVIVDYAHTPDALERLLLSARDLGRGKLTLVFGCGGDRDRGKRPVMGRIAAELSDLAIITSDNPRSEDPNDIISQILSGVRGGNYAVMPERHEAIGYALSQAGLGDTVVIAGKGHENYQIIGNRRYDFDDREVAREFLRSMVDMKISAEGM